MSNKMISDVRDFNEYLTHLRDVSKRWPEIHIEFNKARQETVASTLVRIKRGGVWFLIHCVSNIKVESPDDLSASVCSVLTQIVRTVHDTQVLYVISGFGGLEEIDPDQSEESERLEKIRPFKIAK